MEVAVGHWLTLVPAEHPLLEVVSSIAHCHLKCNRQSTLSPEDAVKAVQQYTTSFDRDSAAHQPLH